MGKGGGSQTVTQKSKTEYPQWTQDAYQNLVNTGANMTGGFLQTPAFATAGFTPDQLKAFDLARQSAMGAYTGGQTAIPTGAGYTPATYKANTYNPSLARASSYAASLAGDQQTTGAQIQEAMNPYISTVVDAAKRSARSDLAQTQADIGARAARAGAFGGSREAIMRGQANKDYAEAADAMVAQLMSQGWDQASALAQANTALRQQTELSNQSAVNTERQTNAGWQQATSLANAAAKNGARQFIAGNRQSAAAANAAASNAAAQYGLGNAQNYAKLQDDLKSTDLNRQLQAMQVLLGIGAQQQAQAQGNLQTPFDMLARYQALVPTQINSKGSQTQTSPSQGGSPLGQILGTGLSILGAPMTGGGSLAGSLFSSMMGPSVSGAATNLIRGGSAGAGFF